MVKDHADELLNQASEELGFRKQIVTDLGNLLKDDETPLFLKILIVLGFLAFVGISFVFTIFLIDAAMSAVNGGQFNPDKYLYIITGKVILLMFVGGLVILKAGTQESALRLEENLNKTFNARVEN
jgi:hypothetical protein